MEDFQNLLIVMVVIYLAGKLFRAISLPVIFGELLGGILIGPLIFNLVDPNSHTILVLAELGIFFLMFHAGLENKPLELLNSSRSSILIGISGNLLTVLLGFYITYLFGYTIMQSFFVGIALSLTAVPIAVRVLKDCNLYSRTSTNVVLVSAVISDIIGLISFAIIINIYDQGFFDFPNLLLMIFKISLFFVVVLFLGFKFSDKLRNILKDKGFTFALILALVLGIIAEKIGLHMVIGAFLAGLFIHEDVVDEKTFNKIEDRVFGLSYSFLGPIFFISLAFNFQFTALFKNPLFLSAIIFVAIFGKVIGSGFVAYLQKFTLKDSLLIGFSMNNRGAVELIIASIGLSKGMIDKDIFSVLIFMAFLTTLLSVFILKYLKDKDYI
jgi:Kef-type K+ transport system membrane component KefB